MSKEKASQAQTLLPIAAIHASPEPAGSACVRQLSVAVTEALHGYS
ncbi:hypothetical protein [Rothia sp. (in: high G+C Gram-positive bacteria)]